MLREPSENGAEKSPFSDLLSGRKSFLVVTIPDAFGIEMETLGGAGRRKGL